MLYSDAVLWIVVVGFIIAFILAFGIGANDVANSFGTSVGSKVLTLTQACVLATICEFLGAVLLGMKVSGTIRNGIIDASLLLSDSDGPKKLLLGYLSALIGACIWLLLATFFKLPVSGSHSIVGAVMGFGLVLFGLNGIFYMEILKIVISWFISPILSGLISVLFFFLVKKFVLDKPDGLEPALTSLPLIFGVCIIVNVFSILKSAPESFHFDVIPMYGKIILSFGLGIICAIIIKFIFNPFLRNKILRQLHKIPMNGVHENSKLKKFTNQICKLIRLPTCNTTPTNFDAKNQVLSKRLRRKVEA